MGGSEYSRIDRYSQRQVTIELKRSVLCGIPSKDGKGNRSREVQKTSLPDRTHPRQHAIRHSRKAFEAQLGH